MADTNEPTGGAASSAMPALWLVSVSCQGRISPWVLVYHTHPCQAEASSQPWGKLFKSHCCNTNELSSCWQSVSLGQLISGHTDQATATSASEHTDQATATSTDHTLGQSLALLPRAVMNNLQAASSNFFSDFLLSKSSGNISDVNLPNLQQGYTNVSGAPFLKCFCWNKGTGSSSKTCMFIWVQGRPSPLLWSCGLTGSAHAPL